MLDPIRLQIFKPNPVHSLNLLNTVAALITGIVDLC